MAADADRYISGCLDFTRRLPTFTDIWQGDSVYELPGFLSDSEVSDVRDRVMSDWCRTYPYLESDGTSCIRCLGQNFWSLPVHPEYDDHFDPALRSYMLHRYSDINTLIEDFCEEYLNRTPEYVTGIATPGFNIVTSDMAGSYWHTDGALYRKMPDIDPDRIISIMIPIQCDTSSHTEFKLSDTETYHMKLRPGSLMIWPGRKLHRFGCQTIVSDHYRITYQAHIYDCDDRALIHF